MDRVNLEDAVLFATARVSRDFARLPGAPGPDWCRRAARALAQVAPASRAWIAVLRTGTRARVERTGSSDEDGSASDAALRLLARDLVETLPGPIRPCVGSLEELCAAGGIGSRRLGRYGRLLAGVEPLPVRAPGEHHVLVVLWEPGEGGHGGPSLPAEDLRRVLRSAMPVLAERLRVALGGGGERSAWLSEREQRVLELLTGGLTVPEIAALLGRSQHTVHDYVKSLHRKLGTNSRGALIARALGHEVNGVAPARGARCRAGPMLAFRTDGRTAFVHHWLC